MVVAGRRFGKSFVAAPELIRAASAYPAAECWYVAPIYRQGKDAIWETLKRLTKNIAFRPNESDLSIRLFTGGRIGLRSADKPDSLRSAGLDLLVLDEYADMNHMAWSTVFRPMLADRLGRALFIGTPKGFNHFREMYNGAKEGKPDWEAFHYTTLQGGNVPEQEIVDSRRDLDERTFRQEYEASFENTFSGQMYYSFDRSANMLPLEYDPNHPICWALDFNVDPMCSVIAQHIDITSRLDMMQGRRASLLKVIDEICLRDANVYTACAEFVNRMKPMIGAGRQMQVLLYGDAAGHARSHAGPSAWQLVKQFFATQHQFALLDQTKASDPLIRDRVNAVNALLCNAAQERRCFIDPRCRELIRDLEQMQWKADGAGNLTTQPDKSDKMRSHLSDCLGYLIETEFPVKPLAGWRKM